MNVSNTHTDTHLPPISADPPYDSLCFSLSAALQSTRLYHGFPLLSSPMIFALGRRVVPTCIAEGTQRMMWKGVCVSRFHPIYSEHQSTPFGTKSRGRKVCVSFHPVWAPAYTFVLVQVSYVVCVNCGCVVDTAVYSGMIQQL